MRSCKNAWAEDHVSLRTLKKREGHRLEMFVTLSHKAISQDSFLSQRGRQLLCVKDTE